MSVSAPTPPPWLTYLSDALFHLYQHSAFCDVSLSCREGPPIVAHACVLAAASPILYSAVQNNFNSSVMCMSVTRLTMEYVLTFIYTGKVSVPAEEKDAVQVAAELFQLPALMQYMTTRHAKDNITSNCKEISVQVNGEQIDAEEEESNQLNVLDVKEEDEKEPEVGDNVMKFHNSAEKINPIRLKLMVPPKRKYPHSKARQKKFSRRKHGYKTRSADAPAQWIKVDEKKMPLPTLTERQIIKRKNARIPRTEAGTESKIDKDSTTSKSEFHCQSCNVEFLTFDDVCMHSCLKNSVTHVEIGTLRIDRDPIKCNICNKYFEYVRMLSSHCKKEHSDDVPEAMGLYHRDVLIKCQLCGKKFKRWVMSGHLFSAHGAKLNKELSFYKCNHCGWRLASLDKLQQHLHSHSQAKALCEDCGKYFSTESLRSHRMMHTNEKPYKCKFCDKSFRKTSHLHNHQALHVGFKPYTCNLCNAKFTQITSISFHFKKHHPELAKEDWIKNRTYTPRTSVQMDKMDQQVLPPRAGNKEQGPVQQLPPSAGNKEQGPVQQLPPSAGNKEQGPVQQLPPSAGNKEQGPMQQEHVQQDQMDVDTDGYHNMMHAAESCPKSSGT